MSGSNEELDDHILDRYTVQQLLGKGVSIPPKEACSLSGVRHCVEM